MNIYARSALSAFLLLSTLTGVPATESAEYYIYRHPDGRLVLSNQKPPPGSKIIKQQSLPDLQDDESPQVQDGHESQPNGKAPNLRPSTSK